MEDEAVPDAAAKACNSLLLSVGTADSYPMFQQHLIHATDFIM